jgi:multidrug efflux pump subunit AcrA (membrane-fusion protein)
LIKAYRQDLETRQLSKDQINDIAKGKFVTEFIVHMPTRLHDHGANAAGQSTDPVEFEVQELKVHLGDHVKAGQTLVYVADHRFLYIEGRALNQEIRALARAAKEGLPVEAEFADESDGGPGDRIGGLTIEFFGNTMDATGLTLPVYIPFANPLATYERNGTKYRTGQYRPGQKVLLKVVVAMMEDKFVVPIGAVAREGAEAYVFRQSGDTFERKPVHVLAEDADVVVFENDGSIIPGKYVAQSGAAALNRALKASQSGGGGGHHHHDH